MTFTPLPVSVRIPPPLRIAAPYALLVVAVLAVYSNVYRNAFVYDDGLLIVDNVLLRSWHNLATIFVTPAFAGAGLESRYYRPLQIFLYLALYQSFGLSTFAFHMLNVVLHAANACLVYALGRKLAFNPTGAFLAALIWAMHPVQVEAVTYISGTADPLYVFSVLCALLIMLPDLALRRMAFAAPLLILCLLSKEEVVMLPVLAMSCLFYLDPERYKAKAYLRTWPLFLIAGIYAAAHMALEAHYASAKISAGAEHIQKIHGLVIGPPPYTCFALLAAYVKLLILPMHLHFDRSFPFYASPWHVDVIAGFALFALAFYQIFWRQDRRSLPLSWGVLWFAAAYFLHSGIPLIFDKPFWEHFMYLPTAGLFLGLGETAALALAEPEREKLRVPCVALVLLLTFTYGWQAHEQNRVWHDSETLYLNIFRNGETSPGGHTNLGVFYASRGEYEKAFEQYRLAIQLSGDTIPQTQYHYALDLLAEPGGAANVPDAIAHLKRALEIDPDYYYANQKLAELYDRNGDMSHAAFYRDKASALRAKLMGAAP